LNAANEIAVGAFLKNRISFISIPEVIKNIMDRHLVVENPNLYDILKIDNWARKTAIRLIGLAG